MQPPRHTRCFRAQFPIKYNIVTLVLSAVIQCAALDTAIEHFFETYRLAAQLNLIAPVSLRSAALVFHRKRKPPVFLSRQTNTPVFHTAELHNVGNARKPQGKRPQHKTPRRVHTIAQPRFLAMHPLMQYPPFRRQAILFPHLFDMNKRALPLAKRKVLVHPRVCGEHLPSLGRV